MNHGFVPVLISRTLLIIGCLWLSDPIFCQTALNHNGFDLFTRQGDTLRLDSLVREMTIQAYKQAQRELEVYFDSRDPEILVSLTALAASIERATGDPFFRVQLARHRSWNEETRLRRRQLKRDFSEALRLHAILSPDSSASMFMNLAEEFLLIGDSVTASKSLQDAGEILSGSESAAHAEAIIARSIAICRRVGDLDGLGRSFYLLGASYHRHESIIRAGEFFDSARVVRTKLRDERGIADCLRSISRIYFLLGEVERSYEFAQETLRLRRQTADTLRLIESLLEWISQFGEQRPTPELKEWRREAVALNSDRNSPEFASRLLYAHGFVAQREELLDSALNCYERIVDLGRTAGRSDMALSSMMRMAAISASLGDYDNSLKWNLGSLSQAKKSRSRTAEATVLHNLGAQYHQLGDLESAASYYERSIELKRDLGLHSQMVETLNNLSELYLAFSDTATAKNYLEQSLKITFLRGNPRQRAVTFISSARLSQRLGDYRLAFNWLDSAEVYYRSVNDSQAQLDLIFLRAEYCRLNGDFSNAQAQLDRSRNFRSLVSTYANNQKYDLIQGDLYFDQKKWGAARNSYARAISSLETSRRRLPDPQLRAFYQSQSRWVYEKMAVSCHRAGNRQQGAALDSIIFYSQMAKSRTLLDLVSESNSNYRSKVPEKLLKEETRLTREIEHAEKRLAEAEDTLSAESLSQKLEGLSRALQENRIGQNLSDPAGQKLFYPDRIMLEKISSQLPDDSACILDFLLMPEESFLFIIDRTHRLMIRLPSREIITEAVAHYLALVQESKGAESLLDTLNRSAAALAKLVLGDFEKDILQYSQIIICPDGVLNALPFESLRIGKRYLIESAEITILPSLFLYSDSASDRIKFESARFLGVADPTPDQGRQLLPFSREEVNSIAELFRPENAKILSGPNAVKSFLSSREAATFDHLHFATHSTINDVNPMLSRLWLSPDTAADSSAFLSLSEVIKLSLNADLVVLSSCESGGGRLQLGEGVDGFARAFMYAGCRNVLVTFWLVRDFTAADFMRSFYENLESGYAAALRKAKIAMIHSPRILHRHPYYWSPFVLIQGE